MALVLMGVTAAVYAPVWHFSFVSWDDPSYVTQNPRVLGGLTWQGVTWALTTGDAANWHPLTWMSHMLDIELYGLHPGGHHVTSLALHLANTLLLLGLLHRITGQAARSAFVAALFALHPLHVESVAWVAERKDVLSTLFLLLTMWSYVRYVRRPDRRRYGLVLALFALGLMAKPMLVTLPFILLLLDVWPLGRTAASRTPAPVTEPGRRPNARTPPPSSLRSLVVEKLPLLALAAASSVVTFVVQQREGAVGGLGVLPLGARLANALVSYVAYIGKMLWPVRLAAFYPYPHTRPGALALGAALLGLVGVTLAVVRAARARPYLLVGWLWYLGMLVPVIGLIQVGDQALADRYTYVPLIGLFICVAWGVPDLVARWRALRLQLPAMALLVLIGCTIATRAQVDTWTNNETLWTHARDVTRDNFRAHLGLGDAWIEQGRVTDAIAEYTEAVRIVPNAATLHNSLGLALTQAGRLAEAAAEYGAAVRLEPGFADAHTNLGAMLQRQGQMAEAIAQYALALRLQPGSALAHNNLGLALASLGQVNEGIKECLEALRLDSAQADWHYQVAVMLKSVGRIAEARDHLLAALKINPGHQLARRALADGV
jgi:Flp pilus assembly protein TadD